MTLQSAVAADREALVALYESAGGPGWKDDSNWLSFPPLEKWFGVEVDKDGRVEQLDLSRNRLVGSIPPELGDLTNLKRLNLWRNDLTGVIPPELGNLPNLEKLIVGANLSLGGSIPPALGKLAKLTQLVLSNNRLTGSIPPELGDLAELEDLCLNDNELTGSVPRELVQLTKLKRMSLERNALEATFPSEMADDIAADREVLVELYESTGGSNWKKNENWLSARPVREWHGVEVNVWRVSGLALSNNGLTGRISPRLGDLRALEGLHLSANRLYGSIPPELGNLTELKSLMLDSNRLTGRIPASLGNMRKLESLNLDSNGLTGRIPASLGNMTTLESLSLEYNQLEVNIWPYVGNLKKLESLSLDRDAAMVGIPLDLGSLPSLNALHLYRPATGKRKWITFTVKGGLPPMKGKQMWSRPSEHRDRLIELRKAAIRARKETFKDGEEKPRPLRGPVHLNLHVYIGPEKVRGETRDGPGDLDSFLSGVCDGLQAPRNVPEDGLAPFNDVLPHDPIAFENDKRVVRTGGTKVVWSEGELEEPSWYRVEVAGE